MKIILIGVFGALGALSRYGFDVGLSRFTPDFPIATFSANMVGCFLVGLVFFVDRNAIGLSEPMKMAIIVGFLGGFTTFSAYALQSVFLMAEKEMLKAVLYLGLSPLLGILCVYLGWVVARKIA